MGIRKDIDGKLMNRSVLGAPDDFITIESKKKTKNASLIMNLLKRKIQNEIQRQKSLDIKSAVTLQNIKSYNPRSRRQQVSQLSIINQGSDLTDRFQPPKLSSTLGINHSHRKTITTIVNGGDYYGNLLNQRNINNVNTSRNTIDTRSQRTLDRHERSQSYWNGFSNSIKKKIGNKNESLIEKQKIHAIARQELLQSSNEGVSKYMERKGKSIDAQQKIRNYYFGLRNCNMAYIPNQDKNPYNQIWATTPSPDKIQESLDKSLIISKFSIKENNKSFRQRLQMDNYTIKLNATHSQLKIRLAEIRFDLRQSIRSIKELLERKTGTNADNMILELKDSSEQFLCQLSIDQETLAHYGPQEGYTIHVIDQVPSTLLAQLDDVSQVEKYTISEEEYNKRDDTFRKFKEDMQKKDPNFMKKSGNKIPEDFQKEEADQVQVGQRCEIIIGNRRGEVKYVGKIPELAPGFWIGVQLDEPTGDTDGKVKGKKYFDAQGGSKMGIFIRPKDAKQGDYPPLDDFNEDEDVI